MKILTTKDGSHTVVSAEFGETYHSLHGAVQESRHIFIHHGLLHWLSLFPATDLHILELGFGTGLNAFLSLRTLQDYPDTSCTYTGLELYPITAEDAARLNYKQVCSMNADEELWFGHMHQALWESSEVLTSNFKILKLKRSFSDTGGIHPVDLIYLDAFAPGTQPEFWENPFLSDLAKLLRPGGMLLTYCAKGSFKRALREAGFAIEALPGPPGKREMTRAVYGG